MYRKVATYTPTLQVSPATLLLSPTLYPTLALQLRFSCGEKRVMISGGFMVHSVSMGPGIKIELLSRLKKLSGMESLNVKNSFITIAGKFAYKN